MADFISFDDVVLRRRKLILGFAFLASFIFHLLFFLGASRLYKRVLVKETIRKKEDFLKYTFIDTIEEERKIEKPKKVKFISERNSLADSKRKGKVKDTSPKGERKKGFKQLDKKSASPKPVKPSFKQKSLENRKPAKDLNQEGIEAVDKSLVKFDDYAKLKIKERSLVVLPLISEGERTLSVFGKDSFIAAQTAAGKYFAKIKKRIEFEWVKYMTFNYKTSNVLGSEAVIKLKIDKNGKIVDIEKKYISGDYLFKDYCETAVFNAGPFPPVPKEMYPLLEKGTLDINFRFGYDISPFKPIRDEVLKKEKEKKKLGKKRGSKSVDKK